MGSGLGGVGVGSTVGASVVIVGEGSLVGPVGVGTASVVVELGVGFVPVVLGVGVSFLVVVAVGPAAFCWPRVTARRPAPARPMPLDAVDRVAPAPVEGAVRPLPGSAVWPEPTSAAREFGLNLSSVPGP